MHVHVIYIHSHIIKINYTYFLLQNLFPVSVWLTEAHCSLLKFLFPEAAPSSY